MIISEVVLLTYLAAMIRIGAFLFIAPPFSSKQIPTTLRIGLSMVLALPAIKIINIPTGTFATPNETLFFLLLQVALGLAMGMIINFFVSIFSAGGFLSGMLGGFSPPPQLDPLSLNQNSPLGVFYEIIATVLLFTSGAYLFILKGLFVSLRVTTISNIDGQGLGNLIISDFSTFFSATLQIAAPIAAVIFTIQILLSILSRVSPSMSIYALSFPVQILATIFIVSLVIANLPGLVQLITTQSVTSMMSFARFLGN
ncbi:MAG: flagellar biosynthetic protein FliR [Actinomycetota bacterium]|nr:flagellar biosynthetic protein FliR [Actinomycetota bacterium]